MLILSWRQVYFVIIALLIIGAPFQPSKAQSQIDAPSFNYQFAQFLSFSGNAGIPKANSRAKIFIQIKGEKHTFQDDLIINPTGNYNYQFPLDSHAPRAFSQIKAWIEIEYPGIEKLTSQSAGFIYEDNRYQWQKRSNTPFTVHWYQGDQAFGQKLLDISAAGLEKIESILSFPAPSNINIYAYASAKELRSTLQISGHSWIGAHADPDLDVIMLSLPTGPEQQLEMERQIPHELMHIILYHEMGSAYSNLPVWFNEGLASISELYPNPDYVLLIENAHKDDALISMSHLCQAFPLQASDAFLAYAQSSSFTRYLYQTYGSSGLVAMIEAYRNGMDCETGIRNALGKNLSALELDWRMDTFGEVSLSSVINNIFPWFAIMVMILAFPLVLTLTSLSRKSIRSKNVE